LELLFTYHPAWFLVAFLIATVFTFVLYKKDHLLADVSRRLKIALSIFRFVSVFIIASLLLGIIIEHYITKKDKPLIILAHDNSESIVQNKDSTFYKTTYLDNLNRFSKSLEEKYTVVNYSFSNKVKDSLTDKYDGKTSNISMVLDQVYSQYANRNIGAVVLSTDGIYNTGSNPIYVVNRKAYVPIYTIGLGDTNDVKDCKVLKVLNNDIAFLGNQFPVEVNIGQIDFKGKTVKVSIYMGNKLLASQSVDFINSKEEHKLNFTLKASSIGFVKYTVKVQELEGEFTYENNTSNFYVDVIDGRQKIALLYNGIHPDLGALTYVIENNKNYEVDLIEYKKMTSINAYDLIICHNYNNQNAKLHQVIKEGKKPVLFIVGVNSNLTDLNNLNIGFSGRTSKTEDVQYESNGNYNAMVFSPKVIGMLSDAPPLKVPFGNLKFSSSLDILAYQRIGNISMNEPLVYFNKKNNIKYGVIMGEGIWRWRLFDQSKNETTVNFEALFSKIISYLAVKENKNPFKVNLNNEYEEGEAVTINAEFYNSAYDLINTSEVNFTLIDVNEKEYDYHFFKTANAYKLELGKLSQGVYKWKASTTFANKNYKLSGTFLVKEVKKEWLTSKADHRLLKNISQNTNGRFYLPTELDKLLKNIQEREDIVTVAYKEKTFKDLIDYKWLFFVVILLLSVEWFIRKYNGAY